ncbi:MAG: hypothetical protein RR614_08145 [Eubacterium sp.]
MPAAISKAAELLAVEAYAPGASIGGIVGLNNGLIMNATNTGHIMSWNSLAMIGGIVGNNGGVLQNSYANNSTFISSFGDKCEIGGIAGRNTQTVENCLSRIRYNTSNSTSSFGNLIGNNQCKKASNCYLILISERIYENVGPLSTEPILNSKWYYSSMQEKLIDILNKWVLAQKDNHELYVWILNENGNIVLFPREGAPGDPNFIEGANSKWVLGSANGLRFALDSGDMQYFVNVCVDGNVLDESSYVKSESDMSFTLTAAFLETLAPGEHTIEVNFETGSAVTTFTIIGAIDSENPQTGDNTPVFPICLLGITALGIIAMLLKRKKFGTR